MGYCVVSDIQAEFKKVIFDSSHNVTDTTVTAFINEASALIDSYLGAKYVVPITGSEALLIASLCCRVLVADRVAGILANRQTSNADANQNVRMPGLKTSDVLKMLIDLKDGLTALPGATPILAGTGFYSNNSANGVLPVFHKSRKQW